VANRRTAAQPEGKTIANKEKRALEKKKRKKGGLGAGWAIPKNTNIKKKTEIEVRVTEGKKQRKDQSCRKKIGA